MSLRTTCLVLIFFFFFLFERFVPRILEGKKYHTWRCKSLDINFANISNQVKFIDTIKYYQQSLAVLAGTMTDQERFSIKKECEKFIRKDTKLSAKFKKCSIKDQEWVFNYLSTGKGVIPYEMITGFDSFDIAPENDIFFLPHHFYSSLKDTIISKEEYESVKRLYRTLKLENLGELNKLYNFQDTIILCEIFEE